MVDIVIQGGKQLKLGFKYFLKHLPLLSAKTGRSYKNPNSEIFLSENIILRVDIHENYGGFP